MSYDLALTRLIDDQEVEEDIKEEQVAYAKLMVFSDDALRLFDEALMLDNYPELAASEGFFSSIKDFVVTIITTAINVVTGVASWITKRIKSLISFRKKKKEMRDQQYHKLVSILNSMSATDREAVQNRFTSYTIQYMPSLDQYLHMCRSFSHVLMMIDQQVEQYVSKDISLFGTEKAQGQTVPTWILQLYEDPTTREALLLFGIKFQQNAFERQSAYNTMPSMTFGALGYENIASLSQVHLAYNKDVWPKLRILLGLQDRFESFEKQLKEKKREFAAAGTGKMDKESCVASCKNVIKSSKEAAKLISFLSMDEEALDTRRAWLFEHALRACQSILSDASHQ